MKKDTRIFTGMPEKELQSMSLSEIAVVGAQTMLKHALSVEVQAHLSQYDNCRLPDGRSALVLNGHHNSRAVTIGEGQIFVSVPRTRRRSANVENYSSSILPKYMRRSPKIDEVIPLLYLKGISKQQMVNKQAKNNNCVLGPWEWCLKERE